MLCFGIFWKIREYRYIANFALEYRCRFAVSADVSRVCDVVYEEERSWPGVKVLRMYGAKPYQFEPTYTLLSTERRNSAKRRKKCFYSTS